MSHVPPPPVHAVNRGITCEGFMSMVAGFFGAGHATTTYGGNIGTIGMTKVNNIEVLQRYKQMALYVNLMLKILTDAKKQIANHKKKTNKQTRP